MRQKDEGQTRGQTKLHGVTRELQGCGHVHSGSSQKKSNLNVKDEEEGMFVFPTKEK